MAKGLRSSTEKANKSKLRSRVFAPVEEARKERLSAKILELATQPKITVSDDAPMITEETENLSKKDPDPSDKTYDDEQVMDIDRDEAPDSSSRTGSHGRIQKKGRGKARAAMVFPIYRKGRKRGPKLSAKQGRQSLKPK